MTDKMISVCGLNCAECPAHVAMLNDDDELRAKTAQRWNDQFGALGAHFETADINCVGCLVAEGVHSGYCGECPVRHCALERHEDNCYVCGEFDKCQTRQQFENYGHNIKENFEEK